MISHLVAMATMTPVLDVFATKGGLGVGREITPAAYQPWLISQHVLAGAGRVDSLQSARAVPPSVYIHQSAGG